MEEEEFDDDDDVGEPYLDEEEEDLVAAFADSKSGKRGETSTAGRKSERRKATSATKCYACGNLGHYASDCPRRSRSTSSRRNDQRPVACLLCGANHFARDCPQLEIAKRAVVNSDKATKPESKQTSSHTSTNADSKETFKKDGTAIVCEGQQSPVQVLDPALPAMSEESTPGTPRMQLFFVLAAVQTRPVWILADSGSVRNLIDESTFKKLPFQPRLREPGDVKVIGGNGEALDLRGFVVLPVSLGNTLLWHEFGVVPELPLEVLIGADVLAAHRCSLLYLKNNRKRLLFGQTSCSHCDRYRQDAEVGAAVQAKFVDRSPVRLRNRMRNRNRIGANFVATLPEAEVLDSGDEPLEM